MMKATSSHPDDEDQGPYKYISPGDTKVSTANKFKDAQDVEIWLSIAPNIILELTNYPLY